MAAIGSGSIAADSEIAVAKKQEEALYRLARKKSLLGILSAGKFTEEKTTPGMFSTKANSPIQEKVRLEGKMKAGGKMQFRLIDRLNEDGVEGNTTLSGTGEELDLYTQDLTVELYRKAVRVDDLSAQFAIDNLESEHKTALEVWGSEKIDKLIMNAYTNAPTTIFYSVGGEITHTATPATALAAITKTDTITPAFAQYLQTYAGTGGTDSDKRFKKVTPISNLGADVKYIWLVHPHMLYELKRNAEYRQECRERAGLASSESVKTFWTNAVAKIDNVVIFEHEDVPIVTSGTFQVCKSVFIGAASLAFAWGRKPYFTSEETDHGKKMEVGWNIIAKAQKMIFNDIDMNSFSVYLAQTAING